MIELLRRLEKEVEVLRLSLERNRKHHDRPFMNNCDHYYKLVLLESKLENMNYVYNMVLSYVESRCIPVKEPKSEYFAKKLEGEMKVFPGITRKTEFEILQYIKHLECLLELQGIVDSSIT